MTNFDIERAPWRKSSYSGHQGSCVEVAPLWQKSSYSAHQGDCVEVAPMPPAVGVRDSKSRERGHLTVTPAAWRAFTHAATHNTLTG